MAAQIRSVLPSPTSVCPPPSSRGPRSFHRLPSSLLHEAFPSFLPRLAAGIAFADFSVSSAASSSAPSSPAAFDEDRRSGRSSHGVEQEVAGDGGNGRGYFTGSNGSNNGDGRSGDSHGGQEGNDDDSSLGSGGVLGAFVNGWNDRMRADPEFAFKVLMEEVVGLAACVVGDMASRPNFGLNELDFVFSTIVVVSILNFSLMYMLAPTSVSASAGSNLPSLFASCPAGHMFEEGAYTLLERLGTFVYKGLVFGTVGFAAGLLGTAISNVLVNIRKMSDPTSKLQVKAPPTVLNAATWAIHMGLSSNLRYQAVNGLEFAMANTLPPHLFKASVLCTRAGNNVLGGMSFVYLARLTGSQKAEDPEAQIRPQMSALQVNEDTATHAAMPRTHVQPVKGENSNLLKEESASEVEP